MSTDLFTQIVALCKRRGFIFPGSEIYGGLANTYDFGPLGVELLRNIQNYWWDYFVTKKPDIFGLDTSVLMSPKVWEASGHTSSFADVQVDCKNCQSRTRADHVIEDHFEKKNQEKKVEGLSPEELTDIIQKEKIKCPVCGKSDWTQARSFNLLFKTHIGILPDKKSTAYLRGEIAQGMFVNFKNVLNTLRPKLPFGLAQSGRAFRNEITLGNYIFRTLEFNLAEFEYFFDPDETKWEDLFANWQEEMYNFALSLGLSREKLRWRTHTDEERSHYSKRTIDLDFNFPFAGFKEMFGLAYRTDFDLKNHMEQSGEDLRYIDPYNPKRKFIPHVIEPTFGINRIILAVICEAYKKDGNRTLLKIDPKFAPFQVAVFPLLANKPELVKKAQEILNQLGQNFRATWDQRGNIGKRYAAQDEIGTPFCVTIDFDTLQDNSITVRNRDTTKQNRVSIDKLIDYLQDKINK